MAHKPILCLDFDGVCNTYESGWQGVTIIPDPPVPFLFEFLELAVEVFEVHIYSSRSNLDGGIEAMSEWFTKHFDEWRKKEAISRGRIPEDFLSELKFSKQKPPAFVTLDDRAMTFTGIWPSIDELLAFKPWNKGTITVGEDYHKASQGDKVDNQESRQA